MLDFNTAEQQSTGKGPIPPDSCVILQMEVRNGKNGSHQLLTRSDKGNEYLNVEFKVVRGSYEGKQIWERYTVIGSEAAAKISMRTLRAIVESARGIDPNDQSPAAVQNRMLNDWSDFQGIQFMAIVDAKVEHNTKDGNDYINNHIKKIVTSNMPEYAIVAQHGEIISDKPLPEKTAAAPKAAAPMGKTQAPTWGGQLASNAVAGSTASAEPSTASPATTSPSNPLPAWAKK